MTTTLDPQQLYDLASSFPEFVRQTGEYHGLSVPAIHLDVARALEAGHDFVGITGFRGAGKSYVTELYACWRYFLQPQLQIIAACGEALRSRQFSVSVATFLHETPWLRHLAPGVDLSRVGEKWNLNGIKVGDWPSQTSRTTRGNFRGPRAHLIILDDPMPSQYKDALGFRTTLHESLQDVPRILHPVDRYWSKLGLKTPQWARTRCVGLWTPTGPAPSNFYGKSSEKDGFWNRFEVYRFPAVIEDEYDDEGFLVGGQSAWPEEFPFEQWQIEQRANPYGFKIEFQVDDAPSADDRSLIRVNELLVESIEPKNLIAAIDPSGGGDEFAYAIGGLIRDSRGCRLHVTDVGGWRNLTPGELQRNLLDVLHDRGVQRIKVEENYPAAGSIKMLAAERNQPLVVESFHARGGKEDRLKMRLPTFLHGGGVSFNKAVLENGATIGQMAGLRATPGLPAFKDRLDALEMLCSIHEPHIRGKPPGDDKPFRRYPIR